MEGLMFESPFIRKMDSNGFHSIEVKPVKQINQYLIIQKIGEGSNGRVYLAEDINTKKQYAIKRFNLKELQHIEAGISQLEREINAIRRMEHPNIIKLIEALHVEESDMIYLVLDYADCGSLENVINEEKLGMKEIKYIFKKILGAVKYLHSKGTVHQDIKPSNILLCSDGRVLLADFGLGHSFGSTAMVVGTPAYQAPEALNDEDWDDLDPSKEDVWSIGVSLYQTLFGKLPFKGNNVFEIIQNIKQNQLKLPKNVPPKIEKLLRGMLCVHPSERMSIDDVINSEFFNGTEDNIRFNFEPIYCQSDKLKDKQIKKYNANVCDSNYSFARCSLAHDDLLESYFSPPSSFTDSTDVPFSGISNSLINLVLKKVQNN